MPVRLASGRVNIWLQLMRLYVFVCGKGGHGAQPQQNIDPVIITAHILTALQQVVSRFADPKSPSVLSFGKVIANGATNVIPNEVYLEGTFPHHG